MPVHVWSVPDLLVAWPPGPRPLLAVACGHVFGTPPVLRDDQRAAWATAVNLGVGRAVRLAGLRIGWTAGDPRMLLEREAAIIAGAELAQRCGIAGAVLVVSGLRLGGRTYAPSLDLFGQLMAAFQARPRVVEWWDAIGRALAEEDALGETPAWLTAVGAPVAGPMGALLARMHVLWSAVAATEMASVATAVPMLGAVLAEAQTRVLAPPPPGVTRLAAALLGTAFYTMLAQVTYESHGAFWPDVVPRNDVLARILPPPLVDRLLADVRAVLAKWRAMQQMGQAAQQMRGFQMQSSASSYSPVAEEMHAMAAANGLDLR